MLEVIIQDRGNSGPRSARSLRDLRVRDLLPARDLLQSLQQHARNLPFLSRGVGEPQGSGQLFWGFRDNRFDSMHREAPSWHWSRVGIPTCSPICSRKSPPTQASSRPLREPAYYLPRLGMEDDRPRDSIVSNMRHLVPEPTVPFDRQGAAIPARGARHRDRGRIWPAGGQGLPHRSPVSFRRFGSGGEGGIRSLPRSTASISCRNYVATYAKNAKLATHHCTPLHAGAVESRHESPNGKAQAVRGCAEPDHIPGAKLETAHGTVGGNREGRYGHSPRHFARVSRQRLRCGCGARYVAPGGSASRDDEGVTGERFIDVSRRTICAQLQRCRPAQLQICNFDQASPKARFAICLL